MASGNRLNSFSALHASYPSSAFGRFDTRNGHPIIRFHQSTVETVYFEDTLPNNYAGGGLTVSIRFAVDTATSGNAVFGVSIERDDGATDLDSDSFAAEKTVTVAAPGTSGYFANANVTFTSGAEMDSLTTGEPYRLKLRRVSSDAADTINSNDVEVKNLTVSET